MVDTQAQTLDDGISFVASIIVAVTGNEDCYDIAATVETRGVLITAKVDKDWLGRVIGREGETADAMRSILKALGLKNNARYNLLIEER
jgi:uncharacterized protein